MNNPTLTGEAVQPPPDTMMMLSPTTSTTTNHNTINNHNNHNNRNKYAPASAPWKRPEAEMEESHDSDDDEDGEDDSENHTNPGAFRVVGRNSFSVMNEEMDLIQVAQEVAGDLLLDDDAAAAAATTTTTECLHAAAAAGPTENLGSSIVSVGSEGDAGNWDTECATMDMLVQLKRRSSTRKLLISVPGNDNNNNSSNMDEGTDQQQQPQQEILSTDCHWASHEDKKEKAANEIPAEQPRPSYAASTAPWTRPTGERQVSSGDLEENHITPGAFRVSKHQDSNKGAMKLCDRISFSDDVIELEDEDDIVVMKDHENTLDAAAFASSDLEQSKEVLEQLKRRTERKHHNEKKM